MDQTFFFFRNLHLTLDRIVQRISENTADIHDIHKIQKCSVCHTGECNPMLVAIQAFRRKYRIQNLISCLILRFILADFLLHPVQEFFSLLRVFLTSEHCDLVFQIMIFVIDQINTLPGLLILYILILKHILHCFQFFFHTQFPTLDQMRIQNRNSSDID